MGNNAIIIRTVGCHQNGRADIDAEQIAKRCVDELRAAGHVILAATVETGGASIDIDKGNGLLRGFESGVDRLIPSKDPSWALNNADAPAQAVYERYLYINGGRLPTSHPTEEPDGHVAPRWKDLPPGQKEAWKNAVDHHGMRFGS